MQTFTPANLQGAIALADLAAPLWAEQSAAIAATGVPVNDYTSVISRSDAAARIPEDVSDSMLTSLEAKSTVLETFTQIPVAQSQTRFPIISALPQAYWVNGETGLKQTTDMSWANKYLNIEEIAAIVPIPEATLDDAGFDVWGSIQPLLENAIARQLDATVFFGTAAPASFPTNLSAAAVAAGNTITRGTNAAAAGGLAQDFSDMYATAEADGYDIDTLALTKPYKGRLRSIRTTTGEAVDNQVNLSGVYGVAPSYPMPGLWPASGTGAVEAIGYDRAQFVVGVRQDITYKVLDQAVIQDGAGNIVYNLAQQDMVAMRVVFRVGWQVANTINYDNPTEATRYPAAVLRQA